MNRKCLLLMQNIMFCSPMGEFSSQVHFWVFGGVFAFFCLFSALFSDYLYMKK